MRDLVIDTIVKQFEAGAVYLRLSLINYVRKDLGRPLLVNAKEDEEGSLMPTDLRKLLDEFTDEELLQALDEQACDRYR